MISRDAGCLIGLISSSLGEGMFLILVIHIESQNSDEVIAFQRYDIIDGRFLSAARLTIKEIRAVCPSSHNHQMQ